MSGPLSERGGKVRASFKVGREAAAQAPGVSVPEEVAPEEVATEEPRTPSVGAPLWVLVALGVVALVLAVAVGVVRLGSGGADASAARAAQAAAEKAVVPVLSYDHTDLDASQEAAQAQMTSTYRADYDKLFAVIRENAPSTKTTVEAEVLASGIVRASEDRVQVLVFVDRPTTNKLNAEPVVYRDQVTLSMQLVDGTWLVDDMRTSPGA